MLNMPVRIDMGTVFNGIMILALSAILLVLWVLGSLFNLLIPVEHLSSLWTLTFLMFLGGIVYIYMGVSIKRRRY